MKIEKKIKKYILIRKIEKSVPFIFLLSIISLFLMLFIDLSTTIESKGIIDMFKRESDFPLILYPLISIGFSIILGEHLKYLKFKEKLTISISEILLFVSSDKKNEQLGIKLLMDKKPEELLSNINIINNVIEDKKWFLKEINNKNYSDYLKSKNFVDYLSTLEEEVIKNHFKEEIKLMEFESEYGDYSYFIQLLKKHKIEIKKEIKVLNI